MHSSFLLSLLSAGALTLALPYSSTEPTTTTLDVFTNHPASAAPTNSLQVPKSNLTSVTDTASSTSSSFSKRSSHYGWVGSFDNSDCKGKPQGNRPKVDTGNCIKFTPETNFVGVYWGTWPLDFVSFDVYTDENCQNPVRNDPIVESDYSKVKGPGSCIPVSVVGARWGSFKEHVAGLR